MEQEILHVIAFRDVTKNFRGLGEVQYGTHSNGFPAKEIWFPKTHHGRTCKAWSWDTMSTEGRGPAKLVGVPSQSLPGIFATETLILLSLTAKESKVFAWNETNRKRVVNGNAVWKGVKVTRMAGPGTRPETG